MEKVKPVDLKPFIFLDVACLREYLAIELNVPHVPFAFDPELAIDDWIFMIFFVGNDFLPHLPSLEIREGAIDALLKIWRAELPRMGGYLTNCGKVALERAQIILEGLAKSEDEIFQRRKDGEAFLDRIRKKAHKADEERQESSQKRRRIEEHKRQDETAKTNGTASSASDGTMQLNGAKYIEVTPSATARGGPLHPSLPTRPAFDIIPKEQLSADAVPAKKMTASQREAEALKAGPDAIVAMHGSNADAIQNRRAIRMANLSAAQMLKAELDGGGDDVASEFASVERAGDEEKEQISPKDTEAVLEEFAEDDPVEAEAISSALRTDEEGGPSVPLNGESTMTHDGDENVRVEDIATGHKNRKRQKKRKQSEIGDDGTDDSGIEAPPNPEADQVVPKKKLKTNPDGTVEGYFDDVRSDRQTFGKRNAE